MVVLSQSSSSVSAIITIDALPVLLPSSSSTSMKIHAWGFVNSTIVTVPVSAMGRLMSNSAANEWCGAAGAPASRHATPVDFDSSDLFDPTRVQECARTLMNECEARFWADNPSFLCLPRGTSLKLLRLVTKTGLSAVA